LPYVLTIVQYIRIGVISAIDDINWAKKHFNDF
jgi:hypothetical protein